MPPKQVKGEYIETDTGNKVSRKSNILGSQNIILGGKTIIQADCTIRGDLRRSGAPGQHGNVAIAVGRYCFFARSSVLRPPGKTHRGFYPMKLGDHVFIGEGAVVEAAMVGSFVHIGAGSVIGKFSIIKDCVRIEEGTVVAPNTVIPPFSRVAGRPGVVIEELPETAQDSLECGRIVKQIYRMI
ncbi:trimeric LpxA-like protein [Trichophaea hybrida]|nr:trimeric LpxA-like protein [Trichophaea hybrida]